MTDNLLPLTDYEVHKIVDLFSGKFTDPESRSIK
jgi:hypothetical protein